MKRWLGGLLAALTLFSLAGCGAITADLDAVETEDDLPELTVTLPVLEEREDDAPAAEGPGEEDPPSPEEPESPPPGNGPENNSAGEEAPLPEDGAYTTKEDVALYIHTYGHLPDNFITKKEAQNLGWPGGDLEPYAPGMCVGGSRFGNYEGLLPEAKGRTYTECDIDTLGAKSRGAKRIVFSNDGLIYYTEDHYESFQLLYGDEGNG